MLPADSFTDDIRELELALETKAVELDESEDQMLALLEEQSEYEETIGSLEQQVIQLRRQLAVAGKPGKAEKSQRKSEKARETSPRNLAQTPAGSNEILESPASHAAESPLPPAGDKTSKKKRKGPVDTSNNPWSEMQGWLKYDDHKRFCRLGQHNMTLHKRDSEESRPTHTIELSDVDDCQYLSEFMQISYQGEAMDFVLKDESEARAWHSAISRNLQLRS
eukprot:SAG25_NODE_2355_length_1686_cov_2.272842_2_plen_222_part_00